MINHLAINGKMLLFETKPGVFAQYGLDPGSILLLNTVSFPLEGTVLDIGCGCGVIGLAAAAMSLAARVVLVDSDVRAVRLTLTNAHRNNITNIDVQLSDCINDLPAGLQFDTVLANAPTHLGREVLMQFMQGAHHVLKPGGSLFIVVNRLTSVLKRLQEIFGNSEKVAKKNGYIVFRAVK